MARQFKRAVAAILISSGSETVLSGDGQDALVNRVEQCNGTAEDRGSSTARAAVERANLVYRGVFHYLKSLAHTGSPLSTV